VAFCAGCSAEDGSEIGEHRQSIVDGEVATSAFPEVLMLRGDGQDPCAIVLLDKQIAIAPTRCPNKSPFAARIPSGERINLVSDVKVFDRWVDATSERFRLLRLEKPVDIATYATLYPAVLQSDKVTLVGIKNGAEPQNQAGSAIYARHNVTINPWRNDYPEINGYGYRDLFLNDHYGDSFGNAVFIEGSHNLVADKWGDFDVKDLEWCEALTAGAVDHIVEIAKSWGGKVTVSTERPLVSDAKDYEEFVSIKVDGQAGMCRGVLLANQTVLTTPPCAPAGKSIEVFALNKPKVLVKEVSIVKHAPLPDAKEEAAVLHDFDYAVARLEAPIDIKTYPTLSAPVLASGQVLSTISIMPHAKVPSERPFAFPNGIATAQDIMPLYVLLAGVQGSVGAPVFIPNTHQMLALSTYLYTGTGDKQVNALLSASVIDQIWKKMDSWGQKPAGMPETPIGSSGGAAGAGGSVIGSGGSVASSGGSSSSGGASGLGGATNGTGAMAGGSAGSKASGGNADDDDAENRRPKTSSGCGVTSSGHETPAPWLLSLLLAFGFGLRRVVIKGARAY
jgi:MYXO-CTERM domain-containing protein